MGRACVFIMLLIALSFNQRGYCDGVLNIGGIHLKTIPNDSDPIFDVNTVTVPIKRAGNLIIIEAQIDTIQGNFILDTGAPYLVLNATYFRDAPKIDDQDAGGINGTSSEAFTTIVKNFSILDLHYPKLTADVTDLSALENERHIKILGLLGTRLFSKLAITVDLFHNVLYIHKLDEHGNVRPREQLYDHPQLKTSFRYSNDVIFLKGAINDRAMWFAFDTGAETNFLDYSHSKKVLPYMKVIARYKLTGIGGSAFEVICTKFERLTIDNQIFMNNRVIITNLDKMGHFYGQSLEGILGYDFFVKGIFTINFVKKEFEMYIYNNQ